MPSRTTRTPFVGRERELATLRAHLDAAKGGAGGVVLVAGEPGIGKTRLLAELAGRARADGWQVLTGRAHDTEGMPPYLPFIEALRAAVRDGSPERLRAQLGRGAAEVARLLPELRELLPDLPVSPPVSPEQERYRLFEGVCDALDGIARGGEIGLLLMLDDLHWADTSTLALLQHLARRLAGVPTLVVAAYRTVAAEPAKAFTDTLAALAREGAPVPLVLPPLGMGETAVLAAGIAGGEVAEPVAAAIQRATEGNPFFIGEVVRHLQAEGRNLRQPGAATGDITVPELVRQVIVVRLGQLRPATTALLRQGAVLGDGFTLEVARTASGLEDDAALDALEEALDAGMLRAEGDAYHFAHALIRRTLYDALSPPRRQRLHLRAAEAIETAHGRQLGPHVAALATHYRLAGAATDPEKAITYALQAGETAQAVFAWEEAAHHWQAALELMEAQDVVPERRTALLRRLGGLMQILGYDWYAQGIDYLVRALPLFAAVGDAERVAETHILLGFFFSTKTGTADLPRSLVHLRAAEAILAPGPERPVLARLYTSLAQAASGALRTAEGLAASRRGMEIEERVGNPLRWSPLPFYHGILLFAAGEVGAALALLEQSWETADRLNDSLGGSAAADWCAGARFVLGDPCDAQRWVRRELARPRATPNRRQGLLAKLAVDCVEAGELAEADRLQAELGAVAFDFASGLFAPPLLAFRHGAWDDAAAQWAAARDRHRRAGNRYGEADFSVWLAQVHHVQGRHAQAEVVLREALALMADGAHVPFELHLRPRLILLSVDLGRVEEVAPHLARCRGILAGRVALADAAAAAAGGSVAEADRQFEQAIATFRRYAVPWEEAEALTYWARAQSGAGRRVHARTRLEEAHALYQRLDAGQPWHQRLDTLQHQPIPPGKPQPAYPDGLSQREVEVLRLVPLARATRRWGRRWCSRSRRWSATSPTSTPRSAPPTAPRPPPTPTAITSCSASPLPSHACPRTCMNSPMIAPRDACMRAAEDA